MKKKILITLLAALFGGVAVQAQDVDFNVVPRPQSVQTVAGTDFKLSGYTHIYCGKSKAALRNARFLKQYVQERAGINMPITPMSEKALRKYAASSKTPTADPQSIYLLTEAFDSNPEAYRLRVSPNTIVITGASDAGVFYGVQTLRKALLHNLINPNNPQLKGERSVYLPCVEVNDAPRFSYRGAHLDVSRHFVPVDSMYRFIDILALHNINRLHWHITDDQGWRIEIKKYPRLTTVGSRRSETVIGHNSGEYDGVPYGGYYTQKDCRDIVKYAQERNIIIVPEIDLPGHMQGALAAYPELGCTGGPYEVWRQWGVSEDVLCAGNDRTLRFIDDVLREVVKIFPSEYIHVGGDECPKTAWQKCPKCQARIEAEGLQADGKHTAEERLQSYVIRHAEATLSRLGRKMIGWDETLEGGLAEGATVMSWRGEEGGIEAARQKHDVIMTPNTYLYFDYYQSLNTATEPLAIGGYLPLDRVYGYEPVNDAMLREGLEPYIVGVQANCWTEYMPTFRQIEYMELPRMAALAETQWSPRGTKDYDDFLQRTLRLMGLYDEQGYNYARHIYDVRGQYGIDVNRRCITATLSSALPVDIRYTLDGTEPQQHGSPVYTEPIEIRQDCTLSAATFRPAERRPGSAATRFERSNVETASFTFNKATASPVCLLTDPAPRYTFTGGEALVDGIHGTSTNFQTGQWIGFNGTDLDILIDLGSEQTISSLSLGTLVGKPDWIFDITDLSVATCETTDDLVDIEALVDPAAGTAYTLHTLASETYDVDAQTAPDGIRQHTLNFPATTARYLRVKAGCLKSIPQWHTGRGLPAFIFVDEISVK